MHESLAESSEISLPEATESVVYPSVKTHPDFIATNSNVLHAKWLKPTEETVPPQARFRVLAAQEDVAREALAGAGITDIDSYGKQVDHRTDRILPVDVASYTALQPVILALRKAGVEVLDLWFEHHND